MKTTIDIPREQLEEAIRHTQARTKREAVVTALADFNRRRRLAQVVESFGTFEHFLTHEELRRLREEG
ncbi:MAG: type II toxin-antitoxin system VapB family antitoxin [Acidobacteriota bacterium]